MQRVENPADSLKTPPAFLDSIFVLFHLSPALYNVICPGFRPLWD